MRRTLLLLPVLALVLAAPALASERKTRLDHRSWSFAGPFGTFDQASLQRGYQVYREVCASCHSMNLLSFRNLGEKYGPFYDERYPNPNDNPIVKGAANAVDSIKFIDEESGDTEERAGFPADRFPDPFPNEFAARASNGGALPPDLSIIVKAREGGANYIYSILTGYAPPATALKVTENMYYNNAMPGDLSGAWTGDEHAMPEGGFIAMKPPLTANKVTYADGTVASVNQMAKDVVTFLAWASEPKQTERKRYGMWVLAFLIGMTLLAYGSYRRVWKNESH